MTKSEGPFPKDGAGQGPVVPEQGVDELTRFMDDFAGVIVALGMIGLSLTLGEMAESFTTASGELTTFGMVLSWGADGAAVVGSLVVLWMMGAGVAAAVGRFRLRRRFARQLSGQFPDWR